MVPFFYKFSYQLWNEPFFLYTKNGVPIHGGKISVMFFLLEEDWSERYSQIWLAEKEQTT